MITSQFFGIELIYIATALFIISGVTLGFIAKSNLILILTLIIPIINVFFLLDPAINPSIAACILVITLLCCGYIVLASQIAANSDNIAHKKIINYLIAYIATVVTGFFGIFVFSSGFEDFKFKKPLHEVIFSVKSPEALFKLILNCSSSSEYCYYGSAKFTNAVPKSLASTLDKNLEKLNLSINECYVASGKLFTSEWSCFTPNGALKKIPSIFTLIEMPEPVGITCDSIPNDAPRALLYSYNQIVITSVSGAYKDNCTYSEDWPYKTSSAEDAYESYFKAEATKSTVK